jgi:hypothetical protein
MPIVPGHGNSFKELMEFFSKNGYSMHFMEFKEFWLSLSDEEREYYRNIDLS